MWWDVGGMLSNIKEKNEEAPKVQPKTQPEVQPKVKKTETSTTKKQPTPKDRTKPKEKQTGQSTKNVNEMGILALVGQRIEELNKYASELNKKSEEIYKAMQNVLLDYKDKQKDLIGLSMLIMSKTSLNKFIDNDYVEKLGHLLDLLPPEALAGGIQMFNQGYIASKIAGIDTRDKTVTEILALGQEPKLTASIDTGILQTLETLHQYLPKLYETELAPHKLALEELGRRYETLDVMQKTIKNEIEAYYKQVGLMLKERELYLKAIKTASDISLQKARIADISSKIEERKRKAEKEQNKADIEVLKGLLKE